MNEDNKLNYVDEIAKSATEKYFDMHKDQLIQVPVDEFIKYYTRTYYEARETVSNELEKFQNNYNSNAFDSELSSVLK